MKMALGIALFELGGELMDGKGRLIDARRRWLVLHISFLRGSWEVKHLCLNG